MWIALPHVLPRSLGGLPPRRPRAGRLFTRGALAILPLFGLFAAADAQVQKPPVAQGVPNALQGFSQNRDQPMKIQADKLEVSRSTPSRA